MLEAFVFIVVLAIIRLSHRLRQSSQRSVRIDVYHHWPHGGPGERLPEEPDVLLLTDLAPSISDNVVPIRRRIGSPQQKGTPNKKYLRV